MLDPRSTGKIQGTEPFFNRFLQWVPLVSLTGVETALDQWSFAMASTSNHIYDAVVVGAGHNGLTAACYLAGAGLSTLVRSCILTRCANCTSNFARRELRSCRLLLSTPAATSSRPSGLKIVSKTSTALGARREGSCGRSMPLARQPQSYVDV